MEILSKSMRAIAGALQMPVIVLLLLLIALSAFMIGWLIVEFFTERRYLSVKMPKLIDKLNTSMDNEELANCIMYSGLLNRQKDALLELTRHPAITVLMRESLAVRLIQEERDFYNKRLRVSDLAAKVSPMLGLLGTLIPLGPGIIALGQGDTITLSSSLMTAFDTTILGLVVAAIALTISTIRGRWYEDYISMLETTMECILEVQKRYAEA